MSSPIPPATVAIPPTTQPDLPPLVLPHFRCSSRPGGSGQGLEVPRLCRFIRRPDHELAAGEEPAPNFLHFQPDHGSRTVPAAPKVRENPDSDQIYTLWTVQPARASRSEQLSH